MTDVEIIPKVKELRKFLRETQFREGKLITKNIFAYLDSLEKATRIYEELKGREHFKDTVKYFESKIGFVLEVLEREYGIKRTLLLR